MKKYPNSSKKLGMPWIGIGNASPEIEALGKPKIELSKAPFDPLKYVKHLYELPYPDVGQ